MIKSLLYIFILLASVPVSAIELFDLEFSNFHKVRVIQTDKSSDKDVKRALLNGLLLPSNTEYVAINFKGRNGQKWLLQVFQNKQLPDGPTYFVPHDNENDAFQAGAYAIEKFGGHLISLECSEFRLCDGVDPNRNFYNNRINYVDTILRFFLGKKWPVITLHNNVNSHRSLGGGGVINASIEIPYSGAHATYHAGDDDNLIIFADTSDRENSNVYSNYASLFERFDLNHIFEEILDTAMVSGHMSNYVVRNTQLEYFNIEAQHGQKEVQKEYLKKLLELL